MREEYFKGYYLMALTGLGICSRALIKIGANPISSFEEGTAESITANMLYQSTKDALLSLYNWSFATRQKQLSRLTYIPTADYQYAYALPHDFLCVISAGSSGRGRGLDYQIIERKLHTNSEDVILSYIFKVSEMYFPPFFDQALIARLSAEFCLPLTESLSRTDALRRMADKDLESARIIDARQDTPQRIENFSLVEGRY